MEIKLDPQIKPNQISYCKFIVDGVEKPERDNMPLTLEQFWITENYLNKVYKKAKKIEIVKLFNF